MYKTPKRFYTYDQQIEHLREKKLIVDNEPRAISRLKQYSYYSCVSAYKGIFKLERNGDYKPGTKFEHIVSLYLLDRFLRDVFLHRIMIVETRMKSAYSYAFCELFGDRQQDYLNVNNHNYAVFQQDVNDFITIAQNELKNPKNDYVQYNLRNYGEVPLWVLIHAMTFGNISQMYGYALPQLQSRIAKEFNSAHVYSKQLLSMLQVLTKFRNVCAHGERLYSFNTRRIIDDMPIHAALRIPKIGNTYAYGMRDLFSVLVCLKYLIPKDEFCVFVVELSKIIEEGCKNLPADVTAEVKKKMGFPENWQEIVALE